MHVRVLLIPLAVLCFATPAAAQNLIVNGSFESPAIGAGSFIVVPSIPGWTTTVGGGIEVENNAVGPAASGNQLVEMDSTNNSGMQQIVPTVAGQAYALGVAYSPRPGVPAASSGIEVRVNGVVIDTIAVDGTALPTTAWVRHAYTVVASGPTTAIEFRAVGTNDGVGGFLDDVTFAAVSSVPSLSWLLLLVLSLMLAAATGTRLGARRK